MVRDVLGEATVATSSPEARMTAFTRYPVGLILFAGTAVPVGYIPLRK
jgi:hypothetical protein